MRFLQAESNGPATSQEQSISAATKKYESQSYSLPFGQIPSFESINGPTYVTAQVLVQQVAFALSDHIWSYSPESFDLDIAAKEWSNRGVQNAYGYSPVVQSMQIRHGAASIALGYIFSKDFDLKKRHIPQSVVAPSSALPYLHAALDQLSLLHSVANPFVAHIAAVDYAGTSSQLVSDYASPLALAEDLGIALVTSSSAYEVQHMSLFATLIADVLPTIHLYDGVKLARETTRVVDVLDQRRLKKTKDTVMADSLKTFSRRTTIDEKVLRLLQAFNEELGTEYGLFEYHGHEAPESVLVVFGSAETSLASQVVRTLAESGRKLGVVSVRVIRPFLEDEFIRILPESVKTIGVLGQVSDMTTASDPTFHSHLYSDVSAAITFSTRWRKAPKVLDYKYPREVVWTPQSIKDVFTSLHSPTDRQDAPETSLELLSPGLTQEYSFWSLDASGTAQAATVFGRVVASDSANNITVNTCFDNVVLGGVSRTDIRKSKTSIEASYSVRNAEVVYVQEVDILNHYDVLENVRDGGKLLLRLVGIKDEDLEKRLTPEFRQKLIAKSVELFLFDPMTIKSVSENPDLEVLLTEIAFLRLSMPSFESTGIQRLSQLNGSPEMINELSADLQSALRNIEVPESWKTPDTDILPAPLMREVRPSSFMAFDKNESEPAAYLQSWKVAARGLAFKEAYQTTTALKPDLPTKTFTVHVQENRRLTPVTYDRNIFHIEFDLGDSGLKYDIGEALGIHAENDEQEVEEFIKFYQLDPAQVVEVANRDNPAVLENRTVWQALKQNIDIFGRPPKRFYEALAEFADDPNEEKELLTLAGPEGAKEFKRRSEVDTVTYADILLDFPSAHPSFHDIVKMVSPMKRREYSIASCQKVTPTSVALMIVAVNWVDPKGRDRFGQATRYLMRLPVGAPITVSVKPSVMKLPPKSTQPLIMAGLGTGLAPFRAFVQHRALEKAQGKDIGAVLLYMGSRHQREEYCYGEEWEAYQDAGVITLLGRAFSRDQPQKIYIQDRMRQTLQEIIQAYIKEEGSFYLCGPTWPVPDVTNVLEEAIAVNAKSIGKKIDPHKEIENLKDQLRYVLEVY